MTGRTKSQGGFSLIEAAIVVAVLALLLGSALYPLGSRLDAEKYDRVEEQLDDARQAVVAYALTHRTTQGVAVLGSTEPRPRSVIPQGRPYLPCPDVNGDGIEDRLAHPELMDPSGTNFNSLEFNGNYVLLKEISGSLTSTIHMAEVSVDEDDTSWMTAANMDVVISRPDFAPFMVTISADRGDNGLTPVQMSVSAAYGNCYSDKGALPWSTLGTHASDPWGNRFTYRVDPVFANSVLGIGPETRSDMFDPRMPLTVTVSSDLTMVTYTRRYNDTATASYLLTDVVPDASDNTLYTDELPGLICDSGFGINGCSHPALMEAAAMTATINTFTELANVTVTVFDVSGGVTVARIYDPLEVINGTAFAVVSHGNNRHGAIPHHNGVNPVALSTALACSDFPEAHDTYTTSNYEVENADLTQGLCSRATTLPTSNVSTAYPHNHSFILTKETRSLGPGQIFDDRITFMSGDQVIGKLRSLGIPMDDVWLPPGTCEGC